MSSELTMNGASGVREPVAYAAGIGGSVSLFEKELLIVRDGWVKHLFRWVTGATPRIERKIPLRHISGGGIVKPMLLHENLLICLPGATPSTGYQVP